MEFSSNTAFILRKYLFSRGFRYIKNDPKLPGKPDVVLPKYKCVVFVNGCFWHHHEGCRYFKWPSNNADFWKEKITKNTERDKHNALLLQEAGWNVIVICTVGTYAYNWAIENGYEVSVLEE